MVKKTTNKSDVKSDKKLNVTDIVGDIISNVDLKSVKTLQINHNSRDKFDDKFTNRKFTVKLQLNVKNLSFSDDKKSVMLSDVDYLNLSNIYKSSNDVIVLLDKKSNVLYSKMIKDNQIIDYDVTLHNSNVISNKSVSKKLSLNQIDDLLGKIDLSSDNKDDILKQIKDLI